MFKLLKIPMFNDDHYFLVEKESIKNVVIDDENIHTEFVAFATTLSEEMGLSINFPLKKQFNKNVIDEFILNDIDNFSWDVEVEIDTTINDISHIYLKDQLL